MSELTIKDLKTLILSMSPIKIYLKHKVLWDDETDNIVRLTAILQRKDIVTRISFEIVDFHHSIVYIN